MSTEYKVGDFHHVKYDGEWTIAQCIFLSTDEPEEEGSFNKWVRFNAGGWCFQYNLLEIDPEPIKRKENE
jgi:hypothetical protein